MSHGFTVFLRLGFSSGVSRVLTSTGIFLHPWYGNWGEGQAGASDLSGFLSLQLNKRQGDHPKPDKLCIRTPC